MPPILGFGIGENGRDPGIASATTVYTAKIINNTAKVQETVKYFLKKIYLMYLISVTNLFFYNLI